MIARQWRGWAASRHDADAYEAFLRDVFLPSAMEIPGFLGAEVLRREDGDEFEFTTLTRFASMEAVKAFAGDDPETARVAPEARRLLSHFDQTCTHHRIVVRFKPVEGSMDVRL